MFVLPMSKDSREVRFVEVPICFFYNRVAQNGLCVPEIFSTFST